MIALLLATLTAQPATAVPATPTDLCVTPDYRVQGPGTPTSPRKMTELPPGQAMLAVEKRVGGCAVNVLKQKDLAGNHVMVPAGPAGVRAAPAVKRKRR